METLARVGDIALLEEQQEKERRAKLASEIAEATLHTSDRNKTGYLGVQEVSNRRKPYRAYALANGRKKVLGHFQTKQEAALAVSTNQRVLTSNNKSGFYGVSPMTNAHKRNKPFQAQVRNRGRNLYIGVYKTAEQAALAVASHPIGSMATTLAAMKERQAGRRLRYTLADGSGEFSDADSDAALEPAPVPAPAPAPKPVLVLEDTPTETECLKARLKRKSGGTPSWWTPEEDRRLIHAAYEVGKLKDMPCTEKWEQVARMVGTRNSRQCRRRWSTDHNAAVMSKIASSRPSWPRPPRPRRKKPRNSLKLPKVANVDLLAPEDADGLWDEQDLQNLLVLGEGEGEAEESGAGYLPFPPPELTLTQEADGHIYDHYGLLAMETLDEEDGPEPEPPRIVKQFVLGARRGLRFTLNDWPTPPAHNKKNPQAQAEAMVRADQGLMTDYMLTVYKTHAPSSAQKLIA